LDKNILRNSVSRPVLIAELMSDIEIDDVVHYVLPCGLLPVVPIDTDVCKHRHRNVKCNVCISLSANSGCAHCVTTLSHSACYNLLITRS